MKEEKMEETKETKMEFKLSKNFTIGTKNILIQTLETGYKPTELKFGKPSEFKKTAREKEIKIFDNLYFLCDIENKSYSVISNLMHLLEFIEILKGFSSNKLDVGTVYKFEKFSAKIAQKKGKESISIVFNNFDPAYFSKFECNLIAAQLNKIISRCEAWQE